MHLLDKSRALGLGSLRRRLKIVYIYSSVAFSLKVQFVLQDSYENILKIHIVSPWIKFHISLYLKIYLIFRVFWMDITNKFLVLRFHYGRISFSPCIDEMSSKSWYFWDVDNMLEHQNPKLKRFQTINFVS